MEGINSYPTEFAKTFTVCFKYFERIYFTFDENISIWRQYWPLFFILPFVGTHFASMVAYIVKAFVDNADMFQNPNLLPTGFIILQVFDKFVAIIFVLYILGPLAESLFRTLVLHQEIKLLLPFECLYPFTITEWWTYLPIYALQLYSMAVTVYMYLGTDIFLVTLCVHLSNEFIHLQEDLSLIPLSNRVKLNEDALEREDSKVALRAFVERHQTTIRLTRQISMAFNKIVFINLVFTTINTCFYTLAARTSVGAYEIISNLGSGFILMLAILVISYNSESLRESSNGIADAAYKNLWYEADRSHQKIIYIIIMRSQKPCVLTSLEYFTISLTTFTKVLSTTYSYISLANHLYEKRSYEFV